MPLLQLSQEKFFEKTFSQIILVPLNTQPFYRHHTGQSFSASNHSQEPDNFTAAVLLYCPQTFAECIQIRRKEMKMPELSSGVPSLYCISNTLSVFPKQCVINFATQLITVYELIYPCRPYDYNTV